MDWNKTLRNWRFSKGAKILRKQKDINYVSKLLNFAGENLYDEIKFFDLGSVSELLSDRIDKDRLLVEASIQLKEHNKIARTHLGNTRLVTYEMPFVWCISNKVKYLKIQFAVENDVFSKLENLNNITIRYHKSVPELRVYYEKS